MTPGRLTSIHSRARAFGPRTSLLLGARKTCIQQQRTGTGAQALGDEQSHSREFQFESDHPELFAAEDNGATPVEMVLVGLAGCLTAGVR